MEGEYVVVVRCTLSGENIDNVADPTSLEAADSFYKHVSFGFGLDETMMVLGGYCKVARLLSMYS